MAPLTEKPLKCVREYPTEGKHAAAAQAGYERFRKHLDSTEGWVDKGEKNGVKLSSKPNTDNPADLDIVKGVCIVPNATSDDFSGLIYLPGMRPYYDSRYAGAFIIERFARDLYTLYFTVKGVPLIVSPRDCICINKNYRSTTPNQDIIVIHNSVEEPDLVPEQSGKVRAHMHFAGWYLKPIGNDLEVTYIVHITLNGSIPVSVLKLVQMETPLCVGTARDAFKKVGFPPQTQIAPDSPTIIQNESMSEDKRTPFEYTCFFEPRKGGDFSIVYDTKTMYPKGILLSGGEGVEMVDDEKGTVHITCLEDGKPTTIYIKRKM